MGAVGATLPPGPPGSKTGPQVPPATGDFLGLLAAVLAGLLGPADEAPSPGDGGWEPGGAVPPWPLDSGPGDGKLMLGTGRVGSETTAATGPAAAAGEKPTVVFAGDRMASQPSGRAVQTPPADPAEAGAEGVSLRPADNADFQGIQAGAEDFGLRSPGLPQAGNEPASALPAAPAPMPVSGGNPVGFKDPESAGIPRADPHLSGRTNDAPVHPRPAPADMPQAAVSPPAGPPPGGEPAMRSGAELSQLLQPVAERLGAVAGSAGAFTPRSEGPTPAASPGALAEQASVLAARLVREGPGQTVFWLHLEPPELGRVELKVRLRPEGSFEVELRPQTAAAYNLLAGALDGLKEALAGRGMTLAGLAVFDPWGGIHDRESRGGRGRGVLRPPAPPGALASAVGVPAGPEPEAVGPGRLIDRKA